MIELIILSKQCRSGKSSKFFASYCEVAYCYAGILADNIDNPVIIYRIDKYLKEIKAENRRQIVTNFMAYCDDFEYD